MRLVLDGHRVHGIVGHSVVDGDLRIAVRATSPSALYLIKKATLRRDAGPGSLDGKGFNDAIVVLEPGQMAEFDEPTGRVTRFRDNAPRRFIVMTGR